MAGKSRSRRTLSFGCALLAMAVAGSAFGEALKGQSRDLGIEFEAGGGAAWCKPHVAVALTAAKPDAFRPDTLPFVQMVGRIRAVVMDQCPAVERLTFDGAAQHRPVLSIEMSRLTKWRRLFNIDPKTRRPACPTQEPAATECGKRADAYLVTHRVLRGDRFAQAELTTVLDEQDDAHAAWISGEVIGKLTIRDRSEFAGRYASNAQLADAIMRGIGDQCGREVSAAEQVSSEIWSEDLDWNVAVRGLSCRPKAGVPNHHAVLVTSAGLRFQIFALLTSGSDAEATRTRGQTFGVGDRRGSVNTSASGEVHAKDTRRGNGHCVSPPIRDERPGLNVVNRCRGQSEHEQ